jgi:hypothetical protein
MLTEYAKNMNNNDDKSCTMCLYDGIDYDCSTTQVCSNFKPTDKWAKILEPHDKCRPITTKQVKIAPGLILFCNKGKNLLLIKSNGMAGYVDLSLCENQEAVDAWIKDVELLISESE